jgi:hypothetical protein
VIIQAIIDNRPGYYWSVEVKKVVGFWICFERSVCMRERGREERMEWLFSYSSYLSYHQVKWV